MPIPSASRLRAGAIVLGYAAAGILVTSAHGLDAAETARFEPQDLPLAAMIGRHVAELRYGAAGRDDVIPGRTVAAVPFAAPLRPRGA